MALDLDPAHERTPPGVAAMKSFKEKLLQGHKVTASQFGIELPTMTLQTETSYLGGDVDPPEDSQGLMHKAISLDDETLVPAEITQADPEEIGIDPYRKFNNRRELPKDPVDLLSNYLESTAAKEDVKIVGPFGRIGFKAVNVSITDLGVAFIIKKDAILFEPNVDTELSIRYRGQDYPVIYAGGFFTFPGMPFTFVSFLRISN